MMDERERINGMVRSTALAKRSIRTETMVVANYLMLSGSSP